MIETKRLILREMSYDDFDDLYRIFSDPYSMQHYPAPFSCEETRRWIEWNIENYRIHGFGLWAVILKSEHVLIGDCGITTQKIKGEMRPEIGYHIDKRYENKGYATEAAQACKTYGFERLGIHTLYSYMRDANIASQRVAEKNGMVRVAEIGDNNNTHKIIYAVSQKA